MQDEDISRQLDIQKLAVTETRFAEYVKCFLFYQLCSVKPIKVPI